MGMFLMSFSNMGTIFSIQMKHVYHKGYLNRINLLKPHLLFKAKHDVCIAIMGLLLGGHLPIKGCV